MDRAAPKISVVMTVYNGGRYLREAVDSILTQTFEDFEFIIVDNASQDDSLNILGAYKDSRIKIVANPSNVGQTKALNIGITQSESCYIARMDADDISLPERLRKQWDYLELHPNIAAVGSWRFDINENGKRQRLYKTPYRPFDVRACLAASGDLSYWCLTHPAMMLRKKVLEEVDLYDAEKSFAGFPQDYDLWKKIIRTNEMAVIPEPLIKYRIVPSSESRLFAAETMRYRYEITQREIQFYFPSWPDEDITLLTFMLEYMSLPSNISASRVFSLFDQYFQKFMKGSGNVLRIREAQQRRKAYYLPCVFLHDWRDALTLFCRLVTCNPIFLLDLKFYRKWFKVLQRRRRKVLPANT